MGRAAHWQALAGPGRARPENPGPRAIRAETGLKTFLIVFYEEKDSCFC